eukprot:2128164-Rhodomonas_salina.1
MYCGKLCTNDHSIVQILTGTATIHLEAEASSRNNARSPDTDDGVQQPSTLCGAHAAPSDSSPPSSPQWLSYSASAWTSTGMPCDTAFDRDYQEQWDRASLEYDEMQAGTFNPEYRDSLRALEEDVCTPIEGFVSADSAESSLGQVGLIEGCATNEDLTSVDHFADLFSPKTPQPLNGGFAVDFEEDGKQAGMEFLKDHDEDDDNDDDDKTKQPRGEPATYAQAVDAPIEASAFLSAGPEGVHLKNQYGS